MNKNVNEYFRRNPDAYCVNEKGEWRCRSVHNDEFRFNKAKEEAKKAVVPIEQIISHVNEFLDEIGVMPVDSPKMDPNEIDYARLKCDYQLEDERDLIWMKVTADGFLGVVAQSNDINFDIPQNAEDYNKRGKGGRSWEYNTSGIIVHKLGKEWNRNFVLVFPLKINDKKYNRHEIETAVGNYLIDKNVPILDYYSHNY